jgi:hypothetical protein
MNFYFSHLVVNGCSFTYGDGLENPAEQNWAALLAAKMNISLINLATSGAGNDRILRTTIEHIYDNPLPNPLYIIAFSHASRREEFYGGSNGVYRQLHLNQPIKFLTDQEQFFLYHYDQLDYNKKKIRFWLSLVNTLKANGISYMTTDAMPTDHIESAELAKKYRGLYQAVNNDQNRLTNFADICRDLIALPCGHYTPATMQVLADYTYDQIQKRWGTK